VNQLDSTLVTSGNDCKIRIWSLRNFELQATLEGHVEAVTCLGLDGNFLLSGSEDGSVRLWDMVSFMALGTLRVHQAAVEGLMVVPESGWLVTCSTDGTVRVWDYGAAVELKVWRHPEQFRCLALKRSTSHVIAGTEEHHIVSFPLSEVLTEQKARAQAAGAAEAEPPAAEPPAAAEGGEAEGDAQPSAEESAAADSEGEGDGTPRSAPAKKGPISRDIMLSRLG